MRNAALSIADKGEWDRITINYLDSRSFIDLLLWHGDDVLLIAPESVRVELTTRVGEIIDLHV
jgi:predicted DNA-binding transcriptional regulator YafY